jgi:hypothetical protein
VSVHGNQQPVGHRPKTSLKRVKLVYPRTLSLLDPLRPPREPRGRANEVGTRLEGDAAGSLGVFELVDRSEMAVGQGGIGERPEMFGGLQLGRIRRQEEQVDVLGHTQLDARMPAGAIQDEDDLLGGSSTHLSGERGQLDLKEGDADRRGQMKDRAPGGGVDKADEVAPVVAMLDGRGGPSPVKAPHLLEDRFQADAVLIDGPELDARLREGGCHRLDERPNVFLKAACCSGSASTCRGRGVRRLPSRRTR